MKRSFISLIILSVVLVSCKKEKSAQPLSSTVQHYLTFKVSGFSETVAPFVANAVTANKGRALASTTTDTLAKHIGVIYFLVYNSSGMLVRNIQQLPTDSAFG